MVVLLDQFVGPTPHALHREPMAWEDFLAAVQAGTYTLPPWQPPVITSRDAITGLRDLPYGTTAYRRNDQGQVEVCYMRWDTT